MIHNFLFSPCGWPVGSASGPLLGLVALAFIRGLDLDPARTSARRNLVPRSRYGRFV